MKQKPAPVVEQVLNVSPAILHNANVLTCRFQMSKRPISKCGITIAFAVIVLFTFHQS